MRVTLELDEKEMKEFLYIRDIIRGERMADEILDLAARLKRLATLTYNALKIDEENGYVEILNDGQAHSALSLATKELF